jgi:hypothetical protein
MTQEQLNQEIFDAGKFEDYARGTAERAVKLERMAEFYWAKAQKLKAISEWRPNNEQR